MSAGDAWTVKRIPHVSFAKNVLRKAIILAIGSNSNETQEAAVIVEIQKRGMKSIFAQSIRVNTM